MFATGVTMGLAEWIIDNTCLVYFLFWFQDYQPCNFGAPKNHIALQASSFLCQLVERMEKG